MNAPLAGIRVIDLSMGWAGPLATRHLADMGAEVIKIESCERFDWWRSWEATPEWIADDGAEKSVAFNTMNRNKLNVTLDLEEAEGRALLLDLVAGADALVENFSGGVLPKLRLDYPVLKSVNERLVMVSMPAFGSTGPWRDFRAYGSTVEQASGLPHLNGESTDPPAMQHVAYGDAVGGLNGAAALLVALRHQRRTGQGQFVDLSQVEAIFPLAIHGILARSATGKRPERHGNDRTDCAPHGVYPCTGDDVWITIQIFDERQWQALQTFTDPVLNDFGDLTDRLARCAELNQVLSGWTAEWTTTRGVHALMQALQSAGVPAAAVQKAADLLDDPHLQSRHAWQWLDRAVVGRQPNLAPAYRTAEGPFSIATPAPTLGQHNREVLSALLGLSDERLVDLENRGIIGTRPRMRSR